MYEVYRIHSLISLTKRRSYKRFSYGLPRRSSTIFNCKVTMIWCSRQIICCAWLTHLGALNRSWTIEAILQVLIKPYSRNSFSQAQIATLSQALWCRPLSLHHLKWQIQGTDWRKLIWVICRKLCLRGWTLRWSARGKPVSKTLILRAAPISSWGLKALCRNSLR